MKAFLGMVCSWEDGKRLLQKHLKDRVVAFMMAWHPRLGQDAEISFYVPKVVAKEIIAKIMMKKQYDDYNTRLPPGANMYLPVPIQDVDFRIENNEDMDYQDELCMHLNDLNLNVRIHRFYVQSPYLTLSDCSDVDINGNTNISFEENPILTELMDKITHKICKLYPSATCWPGCGHGFKLHGNMQGFIQTGKMTTDDVMNRLKKGTKMRVIFEYALQLNWRIAQIQFSE